jgi:hypothetical protein
MKNQLFSFKTLIAVFVVSLTGTLALAQNKYIKEANTKIVIEQDIRVQDGRNTCTLKSGEGTFTFLVRNNEIVNAFVKDAAGQTLRFEPSDEAETGEPALPCKQCTRYLYNRETMSVIVLCMPCNLSPGGGSQPAFTRYMKRAKRAE